MASKSLGTLTIDLVLKTFGLKQGMDKSEREMAAHAKKMEALAYKTGEVIGKGIKLGFGAAVAGGTFLAAITKDAIDYADQMRDLSIRTGVGTEKLSELAYAARSTGADIDTLAGGMKKLSKAAMEGLDSNSKQGKLFSALGISKDDLKNFDTLIPKIANAFQKMPDGVTKSAVAMELFGKSGVELTEFLNQGETGLKSFAERARELGIVVSQDTAEKADQFKDTLDDLVLAVKGLGLSIAEELLPQLIDMVNWLSDATTKGTLAKDTADSVGAAFNGAVTGLKAFLFYGKLIGDWMGFIVESGGNALNVIKQFATLGIADGTIADSVNAQQRNIKQLVSSVGGRYQDYFGDKQKPIDIKFAGTDADPAGMFKKSIAEVSKDGKKLEGEIAKLFEETEKVGKGAKQGMSEAEKEAARLLSAYQNLIASQNEQIALFGKEDEVSKMLYQTQEGGLAGLSDLQKEQLIANAKRLDQMREEEKLYQDSLDLEEGRAESLRRALDYIKEERDTLGMTNEQLEIYQRTKWLGADATDEMISKVREETEALQQQRKQMDDSIAVQDAWRRGMADAITDAVTGAKSLKDAFKSFFDSFAQQITQMIASKWVEQLFGQKGSSGGGSAGGWMSILGSMFGGGRAAGGSVLGGRFYEVGEGNKPELFMQGGREYLIPGNNGRVVPMSGGMGRSATVNQTFVVAGRMDRSTQAQVARQAGRESQRAMVRA